MAFSMENIVDTKDEKKPPITLIYGPEKIGKSTFSANAPKPFFIRTEDGLSALKVKASPLLKSWQEFKEVMIFLCTEDHGFKSAVVDSVDWLENLIWRQVCLDTGAKSIDDPYNKQTDFGKGFGLAVDYWRQYLEMLDALQERDMFVIQLAHDQIKRYDDPETESYDMHAIKLHKAAQAVVFEHADIIGFANFDRSIEKEEQGFNRERARVVGSGERVLYTQNRPGFQAGSRYPLPQKMPFDFGVFVKQLKEAGA